MSSKAVDRPRSALDAFLDKTVTYERMPTRIPRTVVALGAGGGALMLVDGLVGMAVGTQDARTNSFFLVGGDAISSILSWTAAFAGPLAIAGLIALVANAAMLAIPGGWSPRIVCYLEPAVGGAAGLVWLCVIAVVVINLAIWIVAIGIVVALVCVAISAQT